jgi:hypothetical protein
MPRGSSSFATSVANYTLTFRFCDISHKITQ